MRYDYSIYLVVRVGHGVERTSSQRELVQDIKVGVILKQKHIMTPHMHQGRKDSNTLHYFIMQEWPPTVKIPIHSHW